MSLDDRLIQVGIQVSNGFKTYDQNFAITASGTKFSGALMNECEVTIYNLDKATQDYILTETSPFNQNKTPKTLTLDAGRVSYGLSRIFVGNIIKSHPSQPPDIGVTLTCQTGAFANGITVARNQPPKVYMSQIAQSIADDLKVNLDFRATDKLISNYTYTGSALKQINKLNEMSNIYAFLDDDKLSVVNKGVPIASSIKLLNLETGMLGIPQLDMYGVRVSYYLDNVSVIGGQLQLQSVIYPAANGIYVIYKLEFEIASRDVPFNYTACASRLGIS